MVSELRCVNVTERAIQETNGERDEVRHDTGGEKGGVAEETSPSRLSEKPSEAGRRRTGRDGKHSGGSQQTSSLWKTTRKRTGWNENTWKTHTCESDDGHGDPPIPKSREPRIPKSRYTAHWSYSLSKSSRGHCQCYAGIRNH